MWEKPKTLITRRGERDGTLRVEAHTYGIDIRVFGDNTYNLTVEQAEKLRDRLIECLDDLDRHDSMSQPTEPIITD